MVSIILLGSTYIINKAHDKYIMYKTIRGEITAVRMINRGKGSRVYLCTFKYFIKKLWIAERECGDSHFTGDTTVYYNAQFSGYDPVLYVPTEESLESISWASVMLGGFFIIFCIIELKFYRHNIEGKPEAHE
jgi:hypothetical protein